MTGGFAIQFGRHSSYPAAGNWKGLAEILDQSLESREFRLESEDKMLFLQFLRKTLRWLPEERPTAEELFSDEWVRGAPKGTAYHGMTSW